MVIRKGTHDAISETSDLKDADKCPRPIKRLASSVVNMMCCDEREGTRGKALLGEQNARRDDEPTRSTSPRVHERKKEEEKIQKGGLVPLAKVQIQLLQSLWLSVHVCIKKSISA